MPKNVIMITVDALRPDVVEKLPFLGNLIHKSSFFSNIISYQNNSTGAFYSIFTGVYGNRSGVNSYFGSLDFKRDKCKLLTQYFKERGYFTIAHSMSDIILPSDGFDEYFSELEEDKIPRLYNKMIYEIKNCGKNFFAHFHVAVIHSRIIENVAKKFKYNDYAYYKKVKENERNYFQYALEADNRVKKILEEFDLDGCILIIYSDHGTSYGNKFGERFYGSLCYDDTLKTFTIFHGEEFPIFRSDLVFRGVDIMPTILDVMRIKEDGEMHIDGKSLMPVIFGNSEERIAFSEVAPLEGTSDQSSSNEPNIHAVRTNNWKLIFSKSLDKYEFYNIKEDPSEEKNLAGQGLKEEDEMRELLKGYL